MQANLRLDRVFNALSDATRRAMLEQLAGGSATIGELSQPFAVSKPAITKHIKVLEQAGLIERNVMGRAHHCTLAADQLRSAEEWLTYYRQFWHARLNSLDDLLTLPSGPTSR